MIRTYADLTFVFLSEVHDLFQLLCVLSAVFICFPPEEIFRSTIIGACCCKAYAWLGSRSILYPDRSVGSTSHLASSRTRVRIPLRTFLLKEVLASVSFFKHVSLGPQDLDRSLGRHVQLYTETRQPIRPKDIVSPFQAGENVIRVTLGWVIDRFFTPVAQ